jgi:hypothetical protein
MAYDQAVSAKQPKEATLNDRLNRMADDLRFQCDRLESVLSRVNGTPPVPTAPGGSVAQIRPTHSLSEVVNVLEQQQGRLANLATGVEAIA